MGDLNPFRKRPKAPKSWTRPEDYGHVLPASQWRGEPARPNILVRFWRAIRWWLALIVLAALWVLYRNAIAFDPPAFLEGQPVAVKGAFVRCGPARLGGADRLCVVDGDSLRIGARDVRLLGIDAPEAHGRCPAESAAAESAAAALLRWVNAAPFDLVARLDRPTDKYGRDLMTARRVTEGRSDVAGDALLSQGVVRAYAGEARQGWC